MPTETTMDDRFGALALALSKAQSSFPTIPRDKTVRVQSKRTNSEYTFKYAPLESILSAVRKPLADNGLAVIQLLGDGELQTMLLHEGGARLTGSITIPLPADATVQDLGSAITYLRRYSLQAILGIATEEDDDGNRAAGNLAKNVSRAKDTDTDSDEPHLEVAGVVLKGVVSFGNPPWDGELRAQPDRGFAFGFRLKPDDERLIPQVAATGQLADDIRSASVTDSLGGQTVIAHGDIWRVPWKKDGKRMPAFQRLVLARLVTDNWTLPDGPREPTDAEQEELDQIAANL